jgi:uncharacterized protein YndB with AHSA1/START domain
MSIDEWFLGRSMVDGRWSMDRHAHFLPLYNLLSHAAPDSRLPTPTKATCLTAVTLYITNQQQQFFYLKQFAMNNEPFVIVRVYNAPVEKVWKAITDPVDMKQWYFYIPDFKAEIGFEFQFEGGADDRKYTHLCKITEVVPNKKLAYSWRYEGHGGNSLVSFELFAEGDKTRVKLTHAGLETFPADQPDFAKENFEAGWNEIIGTSLKEYVEK